MAPRSTEVYEYRQVLIRMRQGDSEREIAHAKPMGRAKAARLQELAAYRPNPGHGSRFD